MTPTLGRHLLSVAALLLTAGSCLSAEFFVSTAGRDQNPGTEQKPFATIGRAQKAVRTSPVRGKEAITIWLRGGVYYLPKTVVFTAEDSGTKDAPVTWRSAKGATVVVSGGQRLALDWKPYKKDILQAKTPDGLAMDQFFVNGKRQHMARYPNYDENKSPYNGAAADAFSPKRAAGWANPKGGYIHAMHKSRWGGYHYRITGKKENNEVTYEGGWQNNRQMGMHRSYRFVENIFEELDAPGEWYHDSKKGVLYFYPPKGVDMAAATCEVVRLRHLLEFNGSQKAPVRHVHWQGITFRHAARTFMDTKEPLLRSDWTIYRGGGIVFDGAESCSVSDCTFDQLGGNSIFVNNYNRSVVIRGCHIVGSGASGVCFVGDPKSVRNPLFNYGQRQSYEDIDKTPGPRTDNYPADCVVEDCLIHEIGVVEKQAAGVQISMAKGITVRHCSIYDTARAGINVSEGTFGGHLIEYCDVFDTVLETHDHGSFNSWGRDRFWQLKNAPQEELPKLALLDVVEPIVIRNSRWRCDHGWDIDLDDGSSNYEVYNNLMLGKGLKLREGFHRKAYNNIAPNASGTLHPHVWYRNSEDEVYANIWTRSYRTARMFRGKWGKLVDKNLFGNEDGLKRSRGAGQNDKNSLAGDPMFVDPAKGDFRVKDGSPALTLGFKNFPMDQFGVQKASLKKIARTPKIPISGNGTGTMSTGTATALPWYWQGAKIEGLTGEAFSAFGVAKEDGGVHLVEVHDGSLAKAAGLRKGDLVQRVNGKPVKTSQDLLQATNAAAGKPLELVIVREQKESKTVMSSYLMMTVETSKGLFKKIPLAAASKRLKFKKISSAPKADNQPPSMLQDGKLAKNYGPVFRNGVSNGVYRIDLGAVSEISEISAWSYNMNGRRGRQHYTLFGYPDAKSKKGLPLITVVSGKPGEFTATSVRLSTGKPIGRFQVLEWATLPAAGKENTAYQELQVR